MNLRHSHDLSFGRRSIPGATYFVTLCTAGRVRGLSSSTIATRILDEFRATVGTDDLLIATVMPDHMHALFRLGDRLTLSQTISRVKAKSGHALASETESLVWQKRFFDHQLRNGENLESFALYIYLNPYRAELIDLNSHWPATFISPNSRFGFLEGITAEYAVRPEWLGEMDRWEKMAGDALSD